MNKRIKKREFFNFLILIIFVALVLIVGCSDEVSDDKDDLTSEKLDDIKNEELNDSTTLPVQDTDLTQITECATDSDCVPASCCHATACGPVSSAPDCSTLFCTAECAPGTIDCGGGCFCQEGICDARLV